MVNKENEESGFDGEKLNESEVKPDNSITDKPSADPIDKAIEESEENLENSSEIKNPSSEKESSDIDSEKSTDEADTSQQDDKSEKPQETSVKGDAEKGSAIDSEPANSADSEIVEQKKEEIINDPVIESKQEEEIETDHEEVKPDANKQKLENTLKNTEDNLKEEPSTQPEETKGAISEEITSKGEDEVKDTASEESTTKGEDDAKEAPSKPEEPHEVVHLDYTNYSKKQMVQVLESLLKEDDFSQVGRILKEIKKPFDTIAHAERNSAYKKYIEDGGEKDGFEYRQDELEQRFHEAYGKLRERKNQYYNSLEKQKDHNFNIKQEILEKLRELVDSEETGASIKVVKELQKQWKEVGAIPSAQVKGLWANFNALLDRFYDQRSIYFELKELDRKKNYDLKIELCAKAESLVEQEDIREVIKHLNELHEEFKHIGPVPNNEQESVWEKFKAASDKIYSRRKDYYEKLKGEFKLNEVAKEALIEKIAQFAEFSSDRITDWNSKTKEVIAIQKEWETIGSLPKEKAKGINKKFWTSFKSFFHKKGHFFKKIEEERKENLKVKESLVEKADAIKDSDDFRKTSDELKDLQRQWKDVGPVPEKFRNEVFMKFKKSCDHFFDRRRANSGKVEKDYEENLKKKQLLCDELEKMTTEDNANIDRVKSIEKEWGEGGFVPKANIKTIQKRYSDAINKIIDHVDMPEAEKHKLKFSAQFGNTNYGPGAEKLIIKKEGALRRQISTLENDINLWKNNLDFFASSKNADKLKEEFLVKIDKAAAQLNGLKAQLKAISSI